MGRDAEARVRRRHPRIATPGAALAIGALIVVMLASLGMISALTHQFKLSDLGLGTVYLSFAVVGVIVAWHQPRNPMGWVLLGVTYFFFLESLASSYAYLYYRLMAGGCRWVGWPYF